MLDADEPLFPVCIIGGGAAGLSCSRSLLDSGVDAIILEASDRIGGRLRSGELTLSDRPDSKVAFDEGAEFIHGTTTALNRLLEDAPTYAVFTVAQGDGGPDDHPTPEGKRGIYYLGKENRILRHDDEDPDFTAMNEQFWALSERDPVQIPPHLSIADSISIPSRMKGLADAGYANTSAADTLSQLSLRRTVEYEKYWEAHDGCSTDGGGDRRLQDDLLLSKCTIEALSASIPSSRIHLNTHVKSVSYDSSTCTYTCSCLNTTIKASAVIVTIPLSSIITSDISFDPPLPAEKLAAIPFFGMTNAVKLLLAFPEPFWPSDIQNCIFADCPIPEMWFRRAQTSDGRIIHLATCFATAAFADNLNSMGESVATDLAIEQLRNVFPEHEQAAIGSKLISWSDYEFIKGGYSHPKPGLTREHVESLAKPLGGLFFAGEHTHTGASMTVHAAIESGVRAAAETLRFVGIQQNTGRGERKV